MALSTFAVSANAELVTNGGFETTTSGPGQLGNNTNATGWTNLHSSPGVWGYNFIFSPNTADTTGSPGIYGAVSLWGPNNGSANGLTSSPNGGNFVAGDGAFQIGAITQTINGLHAGNKYTVGFYYAGAQQHGFTGPNTEAWIVGFGSDPTQETPILSNSSEGFTGWRHESFTFTADGTSDVLSFLAAGTPNGVPPFSLLDGVSVNNASVPEPGSVTLLVSLVGLIGGLGIRRFGNRSKS